MGVDGQRRDFWLRTSQGNAASGDWVQCHQVVALLPELVALVACHIWSTSEIEVSLHFSFQVSLEMATGFTNRKRLEMLTEFFCTAKRFDFECEYCWKLLMAGWAFHRFGHFKFIASDISWCLLPCYFPNVMYCFKRFVCFTSWLGKFMLGPVEKLGTGNISVLRERKHCGGFYRISHFLQSRWGLLPVFVPTLVR